MKREKTRRLRILHPDGEMRQATLPVWVPVVDVARRLPNSLVFHYVAETDEWYHVGDDGHYARVPSQPTDQSQVYGWDEAGILRYGVESRVPWTRRG
jgi:hypothetical protein